ncbi:transmembrane protein 79 [Electrophorus electricus]|uniref:transmembrane protein 79 n=1 Tax=Electrophorus electricus TaxID=8005 RepID=UPI0015D00313|nr:transmembrane protein 79 [Electrophorus electricus]
MNGTTTKNPVVDKEPSTLPWPEYKSDHPSGSRQAASDPKLDRVDSDVATEMANVKSDSASLHGRYSMTESAKELGAWEKQETEEGQVEKEPLVQGEHLEIEVELNSMPEKAAGVFSSTEAVLHSTSMPEACSLRQNATCWGEETEESPFLRHSDTLPKGYSSNMSNTSTCRCIGTRRDVVKAAVAVLMAALIFPVLVWGGYTFLPFDAPLLDSAPLRLVYTLRCSVFAVIPIVLGILVLGVSRLRYSSLKPQCDGEPEIEAVYVHRCYVEDSISLFLLYFLQLGVMAAYLSQELLKLVPLLTIIFAFGRLVYWIAAVWGSSVRGFGFGFSFLPMLAMLVANLYFIFMADSAGSVFAQDDLGPLYLLPEKRQRFWG